MTIVSIVNIISLFCFDMTYTVCLPSISYQNSVFFFCSFLYLPTSKSCLAIRLVNLTLMSSSKTVTLDFLLFFPTLLSLRGQAISIAELRDAAIGEEQWSRATVICGDRGCLSGKGLGRAGQGLVGPCFLL